MTEVDLEELRTQGQIGFLALANNQVSFFGCQLLTYLKDCVVPAGGTTTALADVRKYHQTYIIIASCNPEEVLQSLLDFACFQVDIWVENRSFVI